MRTSRWPRRRGHTRHLFACEQWRRGRLVDPSVCPRPPGVEISPMPGPDRAIDEATRAAAEAGAIGGSPSSEPGPSERAPSEAERPLVEAGQGEAEGFEQSEQELIERSSHGD